MLPKGDKTPDTWILQNETIKQRIKKVARKILYPIYLKMINGRLKKRFAHLSNLNDVVDQWYWGHRGLEYELLRSKVNRFSNIKNKSILIAGCGTGRDIFSWLSYKPSSLIGIDYFDYKRAWDSLKSANNSNVNLSFAQGDLVNLKDVPSNEFDIIGSDAVFEHLTDLSGIIREFHRILKPGGILYATFGPLWYSWGGDHISGYDCINSGYNHLVLEKDDYKKYLDRAGEYSHSEHDGRTWIENDLFSYLRPNEYIKILTEEGFEKIDLGVVIDPRAIKFLGGSMSYKNTLLAKYGQFDLMITGMSVIYRKKL